MRRSRSSSRCPAARRRALACAARATGPSLLLNGHIDTVPIDDPELWDTDPFTPTEKDDGFLYGRGACDMKTGLTVQIAVAQHLARTGGLKGDLVLHFAMGEECAEPGTLSLLQAGFVGDYGITTEPTDLRVATAERGLVWYTIRIHGRSIHASRAHMGDNPNLRIPRALEAIAAYEAEISEREHALCPGPVCTPTLVRAGVKENAVPDYTEITVDRRLIPGETIEGELELLTAHLARVKEREPDFDFDVRAWPNAFEAAEIPTDSSFARQMVETVEAVTGATVRALRDAVLERRAQPRQRRGDRGDHLRRRQRCRVPLPERAGLARPARAGGAGDGQDRHRSAELGERGSA